MNFGASLKHNKMKPTLFLITQLLISVSLKNFTNSRASSLSIFRHWLVFADFVY